MGNKHFVVWLWNSRSFGGCLTFISTNKPHHFNTVDVAIHWIWLLLVEAKLILMSLWTTSTLLAVANFPKSWQVIVRRPPLHFLASRRHWTRSPPCHLEVANSHSTLKRHFVTILKSTFASYFDLILPFSNTNFQKTWGSRHKVAPTWSRFREPPSRRFRCFCKPSTDPGIPP